MKKQEILHKLLEEKIISIIRLRNGEITSHVIDYLVKGGIKVLEITSNTPNFDIEISKARKKYPNILVGAGTITTRENAQIAIDAGAQFLVTPNTDKAIIEQAQKTDIPVVMGAFTPTEIANAIAFGADIIKLFPANQLGTAYYKSLKGPYDDVKFFAVGGIGLDNMEEWFEAGIDGVGVGSTLVKSEIKTLGEWEAVERNASRFVDHLKNIHESSTD
ncbi:bifunctional 4-hydroxy-2-oxoglutarate aldolase/2-dehydro-3-deoxy-phosphogluconate aldolase [Flagellimonas sp. 2504JD4-2]